MALIVTFATTPLTTALYPKWYQVKVDRWRRGEIDWNGNPIQTDTRNDSVSTSTEPPESSTVRKLLVYLRLDGLSDICTLAALLGPNRLDHPSPAKVHPEKRQMASSEPAAEESAAIEDASPALQVHGVRLMELTDRDSSVMKVSDVDEYMLWDPVVNTFRAVEQWHDVSIVAGVSVVPEHSYAETVVGMAREESSDLLLLPWSGTGTLGEHHSWPGIDETVRFASGPYMTFVSNVLAHATCNVGVVLGRTARRRRPTLDKRSVSAMSVRSSAWNAGPPTARSYHIVLPFFGGDDDHYALRFVLQLAQNNQVTATIIHLDVGRRPPSAGDAPGASETSTKANKAPHTQITTRAIESDATWFTAQQESIQEQEPLASRIVFKRATTERNDINDVEFAISTVKDELGWSPTKSKNMVVVGRRNNRVDGSGEGSSGMEETRWTLGAIAEGIVRADSFPPSNVLVLQSCPYSA